MNHVQMQVIVALVKNVAVRFVKLVIVVMIQSVQLEKYAKITLVLWVVELMQTVQVAKSVVIPNARIVVQI